MVNISRPFEHCSGLPDPWACSSAKGVVCRGCFDVFHLYHFRLYGGGAEAELLSYNRYVHLCSPANGRVTVIVILIGSRDYGPYE